MKMVKDGLMKGVSLKKKLKRHASAIATDN